MSWKIQLVAALLLPAILLFAGAVTSPLLAHDHEHPELNDWYRGLHAGQGGKGAWCCDGEDATHLADIDWESRDGHYRVRVDGEWFAVPDEAVINAPNRDGRAMVWMTTGSWSVGIRCFMPGALT